MWVRRLVACAAVIPSPFTQHHTRALPHISLFTHPTPNPPPPGACVALTALLLKRTRGAAGQAASAVGGGCGEAGDAAGAAVRTVAANSMTLCNAAGHLLSNPCHQVFTCVRLLHCISDTDPVRCARLCPRMLRAASMASKCTPGTTGEALLVSSSAQLQALLQALAAAASGAAGEGGDSEEEEEEGVVHAASPAVRKGSKRRRFRSRNSVLDNWLADDKVRCASVITCNADDDGDGFGGGGGH